MALESGRAVKDRQVNYYMSQGRAFRRVVALFDNIEDLIAENDRRYDAEDEETSVEQGADSARGDDTSKLKTLVSEWVNHEFKLNPPVDMDDKHTCRFINDAVRAAIQDHAEGYIVTDLSFPAYLYEKYTTDSDNLKEGLFKGKILIQSYKVVFTSPSSAKDVEGDGDGADVIENNRRAVGLGVLVAS
ncbi:uncharacterized protein F5147DRAFT_773225 [Suillus discolor]|uniref:Uncharacterized protein n=1 Tax=Suillus discolor TaxID=1912936 RepID=A0A9P7F6W1_9AGAM|nr:uncharacterized protein F5147DRAFT_773225 [Suillus discolor]KAG2108892.1 hypothetical protein F5147DRAFT_773225 [Suillus discolor]